MAAEYYLADLKMLDPRYQTRLENYGEYVEKMKWGSI